MTSRKRKKVGAFAVAVVITLVLGACAGDDAGGASQGTTKLANPTQTAATTGGAGTGPTETGPAETGSAEAPGEAGPGAWGLYDPSVTDYLVDLKTGETTPLPKRIVGTKDLTHDYAVSPEGSKLAYVGPGDNGELQIFVANLDRTGIEQVTVELGGGKRPAGWPAWSPDGSKIAYIGRRGHGGGNVYMLDLATGVSTQVTYDPRDGSEAPSFSPDGSSIVYSAHRKGIDKVLIVPITGGDERPLLGGDGAYAQHPALSPDGSPLSYACGDKGQPSSGICLANADGSGARVFAPIAYAGSPEWSPDGTRIAFTAYLSGLQVIDVATSGVTTVSAGGAFPTWLDDHTLIVEADYCNEPSLRQCPA